MPLCRGRFPPNCCQYCGLPLVCPYVGCPNLYPCCQSNNRTRPRPWHPCQSRVPFCPPNYRPRPCCHSNRRRRHLPCWDSCDTIPNPCWNPCETNFPSWWYNCETIPLQQWNPCEASPNQSSQPQQPGQTNNPPNCPNPCKATSTEPCAAEAVADDSNCGVDGNEGGGAGEVFIAELVKISILLQKVADDSKQSYGNMPKDPSIIQGFISVKNDIVAQLKSIEDELRACLNLPSDPSSESAGKDTDKDKGEDLEDKGAGKDEDSESDDDEEGSDDSDSFFDVGEEEEGEEEIFDEYLKEAVAQHIPLHVQIQNLAIQKRALEAKVAILETDVAALQELLHPDTSDDSDESMIID